LLDVDVDVGPAQSERFGDPSASADEQFGERLIAYHPLEWLGRR